MPIQLPGNTQLRNNEFSVPDGFGKAASARYRKDVFGVATAGPRFLTRSTAVWGERFQPGPSLVGLLFQQDTPIHV
jgi:hypothetical protein